jgi:hypothetical protein
MCIFEHFEGFFQSRFGAISHAFDPIFPISYTKWLLSLRRTER